MSLVKATGGAATVFRVGDTALTDPATRLFHNARWTLARQSQVADASNSTESGERLMHVQGQVTWSLSLPLDDTSYPVASGFRRGDVLYIWFKVGNSGRSHRLDRTLVTAVAEVNDSTGQLVQLEISGRGGELYEHVTGTPFIL